jgi:hypothetical protein
VEEVLEVAQASDLGSQQRAEKLSLAKGRGPSLLEIMNTMAETLSRSRGYARGNDRASQLDFLGEKVKLRVGCILVAAARLELARDGQGTAAVALATRSP